MREWRTAKGLAVFLGAEDVKFYPAAYTLTWKFEGQRYAAESLDPENQWAEMIEWLLEKNRDT